MKIAKLERAALCEILSSVGPDAPTLCEGWDAADLAAHLWVREMDPIAAPGIIAKPLAGLTEQRMADCLEKFGYDGLVTRLSHGPGTWSVFSVPGVDEAANAVEYFVHLEDVRRANGHPEPRGLGDDVEEFMWRRLALMGRVLFRRGGVGVILADVRDDDARIHAQPGATPVTLVGLPSELMLYAYGRREAAAVEVIGTPESLARFQSVDLGI